MSLFRTDEKNALLAEYSQLKQTSSNLRSELDSAHMQQRQHQVRYDEKIKALESEMQSLRISKVAINL